MKRKSLSDKSIFTKHLTSTISVMLVMLILGLVGIIAVGTRGVTDMLKSRTGFTIVMNDEATPSDIANVKHSLDSDQAIRTHTFSSAEENMLRWNSENSEDVMAILGVNPFPADFSVRVIPDWSDSNHLAQLSAKYAALRGVSEITLSSEAITSLHRHISTLNWILISVAAGLLLISFVLINNTVRLTVYSRRFLIHTMKLVGATGSFIRGPFLRSGLMSGLVAGFVACGIIIAGVILAHSKHIALSQCLPWAGIWWIFPAIILSAMGVCALASALATNRYLRMDYDDLF